jgi:putative MATE family efflux protein
MILLRRIMSTAEVEKHGEKIAQGKDWTKGPIARNLLLLSWPMVIMEGVWIVSQLLDMMWVGRIGPDSIAGVGIANTFLTLVYSVDMGMIVGVRAMIARYAGAGDIKGANHITAQAMLFAFCWGLLVTLIGVFLAGPILSIFGAEATVLREGTAYIRLMLAGWVFFEVLVFGLYAIQAAGDTVTPMLIESAMRVIHMTFCPFLVLGLWFFPRLGVTGAALSNVGAQTLGCLAIIWIVFGGKSRLKVKIKDLRFAPGTMWRLLKIGVPALMMNLQNALGSNLLMRLVVPFGTVAVAAQSLTSRVEMFLFVPGLGLGTGVGVMTGQNLGANQVKRVSKTAWVAVGFVQAFMVICCVIILIWAEGILGIFTQDRSVVEMGAMFLRISTSAYFVMSISQIMQSCVSGAGDTVPIMVISIAVIWAVQLPLAFLLSRITGLEVFGIRWAMAAGMGFSTIAYLIYYLSGKWKTKKI